MANALADMSCVACRPDSPAVSGEEIDHLRLQIPEWDLIESEGVRRLRRTFEFDDFRDALAFANRVGAAADADGHHPEITVGWGSAAVTWWTHTMRNLHLNDFVMAAKTDRIWDAAAGGWR